MRKLIDIKGFVKTGLYNSIVEITNENEDLDYEAIDRVIEFAIDLIFDVSWSCAVDFVREDMKKLFKENKENEISDV